MEDHQNTETLLASQDFMEFLGDLDNFSKVVIQELRSWVWYVSIEIFSHLPSSLRMKPWSGKETAVATWQGHERLKTFNS